jgi:predicted nucleotidyltransferase
VTRNLGKHITARLQHAAFPNEPNVDIKSLRNTLDAHRAANRDLLIRKVDGTGHYTRLHKQDAVHHAPLEGKKQAKALRMTEDVLGLEKANPAFKRIKFSASGPAAEDKGGKSIKGITRDLSNLWRLNGGDDSLPTRFRLPWLAHLPDASPAIWMSAVDRLSAEVRAFEQYVSPSEEERRAAEYALSDIIQAIKYADDNLDVDVIGSRASGTADPLSDLDIIVSNPLSPLAMNNLKTPREILDLLENAFRGGRRNVDSALRPVEVIINVKHAKVPILVCRHIPSGLPVQVQSTPRAYDNTEYVKAFQREYPTLRSLFKILKQVLAMRGLNVGNHGGLTSYPLINMIVAALKFSEGRIHQLDAGRQLLFFLDMYAEIDFSTKGISTRPVQYFPKYIGHKQKSLSKTGGESAPAIFEEELAGQRRMGVCLKKNIHLMTLQDPANPLNDLGKSTYMIKDIQALFIDIRAKLKQAMAEWEDSGSVPSLAKDRSSPRSLLDPCVGGDYRIYEHERSDLQLLGRKALESPKRG